MRKAALESILKLIVLEGLEFDEPPSRSSPMLSVWLGAAARVSGDS